MNHSFSESNQKNQQDHQLSTQFEPKNQVQKRPSSQENKIHSLFKQSEMIYQSEYLSSTDLAKVLTNVAKPQSNQHSATLFQPQSYPHIYKSQTKDKSNILPLNKGHPKIYSEQIRAKVVKQNIIESSSEEQDLYVDTLQPEEKMSFQEPSCLKNESSSSIKKEINSEEEIREQMIELKEIWKQEQWERKQQEQVYKKMIRTKQEEVGDKLGRFEETVKERNIELERIGSNGRESLEKMIQDFREQIQKQKNKETKNMRQKLGRSVLNCIQYQNRECWSAQEGVYVNQQQTLSSTIAYLRQKLSGLVKQRENRLQGLTKQFEENIEELMGLMSEIQSDNRALNKQIEGEISVLQLQLTQELQKQVQLEQKGYQAIKALIEKLNVKIEKKLKKEDQQC